MRNIPVRLQREDFGFILLLPKFKKPFEKDWVNKPYKFNDAKLQEHLAKGGNVGILCGLGNLLIVDFDDKSLGEKYLPLLPKTFTVQTWSGKYHCYYFCDDLTPVMDTGKMDILGKGRQAVIPPSEIIPPTEDKTPRPYSVFVDTEIATIKRSELDQILNVNIAEKLDKIKSQVNTSTDADKVKREVSFERLLRDSGIDVSHNPCMCPLGHDSQSRQCFHFDDNKQVAYCFHCDWGGDVISLAMEKDNVDFKTALYSLAQKYNIAIIEKVDAIPQEVPKFQYLTKHLKNFDMLDKSLSLYGTEYLPCKKLEWYRCIGSKVNTRVYQYKGIRTDGRVHKLMIITSGKGKKNFKVFSEKICKVLGLERENPSSLHPEQLVGKVIKVVELVETGAKKKDGTPKKERVENWKANAGYFDCDDLQIDEAYALLTDDDLNVSESRSYLRIATDLYGENEINKKLVEHTKSQRLSYLPRCSIALYSQPKEFPSDVVIKGDLRRYFVVFIPDTSEAEEIYEQRLSNDFVDSERQIELWGLWLKLLAPKPLSYNADVGDSLKKYAVALVNYGLNYSEPCAIYTKIMEQTLIELLFKFSVLLAVSEESIVLEKRHVDFAFMDLFELFYDVLRFVDTLMPNLKSDMKWVLGDDRIAPLLSWLKEQDAVSYERSNVSIAMVKNRIESEWSVKESTAKYHWGKLAKTGLVVSQQVGQNGSKVWLSDKALLKLQGSKGVKGVNVLELYKMVISEYNSIFQNPKRLEPLEPLTPSNVNSVTEIKEKLNQDRTFLPCGFCGSKETPCYHEVEGKPSCYTCYQKKGSVKK